MDAVVQEVARAVVEPFAQLLYKDSSMWVLDTILEPTLTNASAEGLALVQWHDRIQGTEHNGA